ncbi:unnamed protein product [Rotaria magnacalcarata]|nr:unnamed protein product [Rotaria magnacalcarata]CAF3229549.1 unnamed protein product [Rotaria socialis]CAF3723663.1 unnamed protein product [Rotaria socialis]CAF3740876.1 unnamed protein product [Rotaria socialis]CAF3753850.1 unnamed protein product [Rotaria socialis]
MGCNIYNTISKRYYTFFYFPIVTNVLPITTTITSSLLAYRNVRRIVCLQRPVFRRRLDRQMTAITLARIVVLIALGSPYIFISLYQINLNVNTNNYMQLALFELISAISFYVFLIVSSRFRRQEKTVLVKKVWRSIKLCSCKTSTTNRRNQISPEVLPPSSSGNEICNNNHV